MEKIHPKFLNGAYTEDDKKHIKRSMLMILAGAMIIIYIIANAQNQVPEMQSKAENLKTGSGQMATEDKTGQDDILHRVYRIAGNEVAEVINNLENFSEPVIDKYHSECVETTGYTDLWSDEYEETLSYQVFTVEVPVKYKEDGDDFKDNLMVRVYFYSGDEIIPEHFLVEDLTG